MGFGYWACTADIVHEEFIQRIAPREFTAFCKSLNDNNISLEEYAINIENDNEPYPEIDATYRRLLDKFLKLTKLTLYLGYHDSESEGSRYDEVNGAFWGVLGVRTLTPAGVKYVDEIKQVYYVVSG